jgi:hypothetical protein
LQRVAGPLLSQIPPGNAVERRVYRVDQFVTCRGVSGANAMEQLCDLRVVCIDNDQYIPAAPQKRST